MKIVALSDSPMNSGFGRIANEVFERLAQRGYEIHVVSLLWDGIMPEKQEWFKPLKHKYSFSISGCAGRDVYSYTANIINITQPDVVMSIQDFPYATTLFYNCRVDWSRKAFMFITPIDGYPIEESWLQLVDDADGAMVISEFGVDAMKQAGKRVGLCPPGINTSDFYPASEAEKNALRSKAGIPADAFVVGMMAMNQGRKDIPHTLDGFAKFSMDKPNALLLMDMDAANPAGWNIPALSKTKNIPKEKILYREDLQKKGLTNLRERYAILDAHSVLAHREGFGLPLTESQACRIPTIAMDWCSGTEICGQGRGYLVRRNPQPRNSTWGNALDYDPDVDHYVEILNSIYGNPAQAKAVAEVGYQWSKARTWDIAANNVDEMLRGIGEKLDARRKRDSASVRPVAASPAPSADLPTKSPESLARSDTDGRREQGIQSERIDGSAVQRSAE